MKVLHIIKRSVLLTLLLGLPTFASDHKEDFNQRISKGKGTSKSRKQSSDQFGPAQNNQIIHAIQYNLNEKGLSETFSIQSKTGWEQQQRENHTDLYHSFNAAISYLSGLLEQVEKDTDLLWTYKHATFRKDNGDRVSLEGICPLFIYDGTELKFIEIPNKCMYQIENIRIRLELLAILDILAYAKKTVFYKDTIDSYNQENANALNFPLGALIEIRKNGLNNVLQCNGKHSLDDDHYLKIILQILEEIKSHCPTELHHNLIPFLPIYERRNSQTYIKGYRVNKHAFERLYSNQARSTKEVQETAHICFNSFGHYIQNAVEINDCLKYFIGDPFNIFLDILSGYSLLNKTIEKYNAFLNNRCFQLTQNRKIIFQGNPVHLDAHLKNVYQYIEYQIQKLNIPRTELAKILGIELSQDVEPQESATAALHVQGQNSTSSATSSETQRQGSSHKKRKRARRKTKTVQLNGNTQPQPQRIDSSAEQSEEKQREKKEDEVVELTLSVPSSKQPVDSSAKQSEESSDESTDQGSTNKSDHSDNQVSTNELSSDESTHEGSSDESNETKPLHVQGQHSVPSATPSQQQRGRKTGTSHPTPSTRKQNNNKTQHHNPNHQTFNNTPSNTLNNGVSNHKQQHTPQDNKLNGEEQHNNSNDVIINHEQWDYYFRTTNKAAFRNLENMSIEQTAYAIELCETLLRRVFHPPKAMKPNELTRMFADLKFVVQPNRHGKGSVHHIFPAPDNPLFGHDKYFNGVKMNLHFPTGSQSFVYQYFTVLKKELAGLFGLTKEYIEDNLPLLQKRLAHLNSLPASSAKDKGKEKEKETEREEKKEKEPEKKKTRSSPNKKNKTNHKHNHKHKK